MSLDLFNNLFNNVNKDKNENKESTNEFSKELEEYLKNSNKENSIETRNNSEEISNMQNENVSIEEKNIDIAQEKILVESYSQEINEAVQKNIQEENSSLENHNAQDEKVDLNDFREKSESLSNLNNLENPEYKKDLNNFEENLESKLDLNDFEEKLLTEFVDKFKLERAVFLQECEILSSYNNVFFIYGENENSEYLATNCKKENSNEVFHIAKQDVKEVLNEESAINKVFIVENGNYAFDEKLNNEITSKLKDIAQKIFEEQNNIMQERRIEGHVYEVIELSGNTVCLIDNNQDSGMSFEEFLSPTFENAAEGDIFKFENGEYKKIQN